MTKLFVMVGTNPIPCYISALYLLNYYSSDKELYLVCSKDDPSINQAGTYPVGERIQDQVKVLFPNLQIFLKEISDVASSNAITAVLQDCYNTEDEVHLNYTGGTKSMAAIAFNMLKGHPYFSSSYLDGRRHIMIMDGEIPDSADLRTDAGLRLNLETIIRLHGLDDFAENPINPGYRGLMDEIGKWLTSKRINELYCSRNHQKTPPEKLLEEEKQVGQKREKLITASGIRDHESNEKRINEFIDGKWLERYLFEKLNITEHQGVDIYFDVEKDNYCQLDLIAIYGYQMTLISVTTDSHQAMSKLKAFEAIHRAHQLGGDEAKTIMVTFIKDPRNLEANIRGSFGSLVPGFKAYGINDFYDDSIFSKIIKYIKE